MSKGHLLFQLRFAICTFKKCRDRAKDCFNCQAFATLINYRVSISFMYVEVQERRVLIK